MLKKISKALIPILVFSNLLVGCSFIDNAKTKMGLKNNDFEYIKNENVDQIIIQSTRDTGFRFVVTDKRTIQDMYSLLSSSKEAKEKTDLEPDYIFEMHMGDEVKKFNYVVGVNSKDKGNFYDDKKIYSVSSRLDNDIIQNLSFVRKPREFASIYFGSILKVLNEKKDYLNEGNKKVGIDMLSDVECTKYMLSTDIEDFKKNASKIVNNIGVIKGDKDKYDIIITVSNQGYTSKTFKTSISIENKIDHSYMPYYVTGNYDLNSWEISLVTKKPSDW
ncbi:hypothetical protein [Clostridium paridis]|uniref:YhfM-like domain-containing protein n=1 Tax=Clostridium paridis TaxID=2803863 RepID=A0A937FH41_9CLOT|nr:hypothetical protein [Clostridium paridis]MBL4931441.1 hypothetical protein [Clostridium paridis]